LRKAKELERWRREPISDLAVGREAVWSFKVDRLEEQIDTYWKQRAHVNWFRFGDRNTKYFHNACSVRKRRNRIGRMLREDGSWVEEEGEKKDFISNYFLQLFSTSVSADEGQLQRLISAVQPRVTPAMNAQLMSEFIEEEIKQDLFAIGDLKPPGLDGLPTVFYKTFWDVVGVRLTREAMEVLKGGRIPTSWNEMTIALIPKTEKPEWVTDLRPISLCNVVYKVVSKVLSNRLREVLLAIITPNQCAFVSGCLISHNILITYELTHYLLNKREGELAYAALKLDMSKGMIE